MDAIEAAIKEGTQSVKYSDKMVTYRNLEEMLKIRDLIRRELGLTTGTAQRILTTYKKGL